MATRMQQRRATSAEWTAANPVLADGEIGVEKDTGIVKIGNGSSAWNALAPILGSQYLPMLGKANDSERLDGLDSSAFARAADLTNLTNAAATKTDRDDTNTRVTSLEGTRPSAFAYAQLYANATSGVRSGNTWYKVSLAAETHDSHAGHTVGAGYTVPAGQAGTYLVDGLLWVVETDANAFIKSAVYVDDVRIPNVGYRGSLIHGGNGSIFGGSGSVALGVHVVTLAAGAVVTLWGNCSTTWKSYYEASEEIASQLTLVRIR